MRLNLQSVPVRVIHVPTRTDREESCRRLFTAAGFHDAQFFDAVPSSHRFASGALSFGRLYEQLAVAEPFTPTLICEDDIWLTENYKPVIEFPDDADAVYLGLSYCSSPPDDDSYTPGIQSAAVPGFSDMVQLHNMLSTHAVLVCSRRFALFGVRACAYTLGHLSANRNLVWDLAFSRRLADYNVYAYKNPLFFQDSRVGGNEAATKISFENIPVRTAPSGEPEHWKFFDTHA